MGFFKNLFDAEDSKNKQAEDKFIHWENLNAVDQLEEIKEQSRFQSILIFKHSTRCGISRMVIKKFENLFKEEHKKLKVYYLDLLSYRNVSDEVGYTFQVMHQSPQLLIIKNGSAVYHASHYDILETQLSRFV